MDIRHRCLLLVTACALAGCAGFKRDFDLNTMYSRDYVGPADSEAAALARLSAQGIIRITPASSCADFAKPATGVALFSTPSLKDYSHLHNRKLGTRGVAPSGLLSTEVRLRAGEPVAITYSQPWERLGVQYVCHQHRTFTPQADSHYQILGQPGAKEGQCELTVTEVTTSATPVATAAAPLCGV